MFNTFLAAAGGLTPPSDLIKETDYTGFIIISIMIIIAIAIFAIIGHFINKNNNDNGNEGNE